MKKRTKPTKRSACEMPANMPRGVFNVVLTAMILHKIAKSLDGQSMPFHAAMTLAIGAISAGAAAQVGRGRQ